MINLVFTFWQYRISMLFLLVFQLLFLPLRYKKIISIGIAAGCLAVTGLLDYIKLFTDYGLGNELFTTVIQIVIVQGTAYILCWYRDCRALFTGITSSTYVLPGNIISTIIYMYMQDLAAALLTQAAVHIVLLVLMAALRWYYLREMEISGKTWWEMCTLPALFYAVMYTMACWPGSLYERKENWLAAVLFLILMGVTFILVVKMFAQQNIDNELERNKEFLETYAWGLRREAETLRNAEEKMRIMQHDSRHVYRMIGTYLAEGKTEQVQELLRQMDVELQSRPSERFCENIAVNGILLGSDAKAKQQNVNFICKADVPKELKGVSEFEFATVVSNLIENALYAASQIREPGERVVSVRIFPVKGQLILEIMNTYAAKCEFSKVTGLPVSTKGAGHGYGLRSVEAFANKNHAVFQYSVEEGRFCVRLLADL